MVKVNDQPIRTEKLIEENKIKHSNRIDAQGIKRKDDEK